jgi:DNA-binding NarL/FixJ family response regulator
MGWRRPIYDRPRVDSIQSPSVAREGPVRVGIVEDDPILGGWLAAVVAGIEGLTVAGIAETLREGLSLLSRPADVMLVDLALPDGSGLELIAAIRSRPTACRVLVISVFADVHSVVRAIECGADGYLLKGAESSVVESAIRTVLAGGAPISPGVAGHILARIRDQRPAAATNRAFALTLTPKEICVLEHLAKGLSYKEAAHIDGISYHTVVHHVKAIYRKLSVNSRGEAVFEACQAGLIRLET